MILLYKFVREEDIYFLWNNLYYWGAVKDYVSLGKDYFYTDGLRTDFNGVQV